MDSIDHITKFAEFNNGMKIIIMDTRVGVAQQIANTSKRGDFRDKRHPSHGRQGRGTGMAAFHERVPFGSENVTWHIDKYVIRPC